MWHQTLIRTNAGGLTSSQEGLLNDWCKGDAKNLLASPSHQSFAKWSCAPEIRPFPFKPPVFWSLWAIKHFSPLNFSFKRIVGAYYFQTLPEAPYQDGFYRCFHDLTTGSLNTLSEFGRADGWVDLPIPSKKWGVELLRDGQLLEQHNDHLSSTGQYWKILDIDEYFVLDFRTEDVVQAHPRKSVPSRSMFYFILFIFSTFVVDVTRLFHVVFSDNFHGERWLSKTVNVAMFKSLAYCKHNPRYRSICFHSFSQIQFPMMRTFLFFLWLFFRPPVSIINLYQYFVLLLLFYCN